MRGLNTFIADIRRKSKNIYLNPNKNISLNFVDC